MQDHRLAPTIEDGDFELLKKGIPDFLGVNYYYTLTYESNPLDGVSEGAFNTTGKKGTTESVGVPGLVPDGTKFPFGDFKLGLGDRSRGDARWASPDRKPVPPSGIHNGERLGGI